MAWWQEEYEGLRAEARDMATTIAAYTASVSQAGPGDAHPVVAMRERLAAFEVVSPDGVDEVIDGVPCRVFRPAGVSRGTYLHFHGGGMIAGTPRMRDVANAETCRSLGVRVISVDYRLAPEFPFPAGPDDCFAVARWLLDHEPGPIVAGGDSAGAYLTVLTLVRVRDELGAAHSFAGANLLYGVYDMSATPSNRGVRPTDVPDMLDATVTDRVREAYLPGRSREDARDRSISPLYADLREMPKALLTVGFADHLLDDSLFLAARWQAYGGQAELAVYPDCGHGFDTFPTELAKRANARIDDFLASVFA